MKISLQSKMGNVEIETGAAVIVYIDDDIGGATATKAFEYGSGYDLLNMATTMQSMTDDLIKDAADIAAKRIKGEE